MKKFEIGQIVWYSDFTHYTDNTFECSLEEVKICGEKDEFVYVYPLYLEKSVDDSLEFKHFTWDVYRKDLYVTKKEAIKELIKKLQKEIR
jgi:hypothetical protein